MYHSAPFFPEVSIRAPLLRSLQINLPRKGKGHFRPSQSIIQITRNISRPMTSSPAQTAPSLNESVEPSEPSKPTVLSRLQPSWKHSKHQHLPAISLEWPTLTL